MLDLLEQIRDLSNENEGFLSLIMFVIAILFGWMSGIFQALRRRPKFVIDVIGIDEGGPTFCCIFDTGREHNGYKLKRTAIVLYLKVSNRGYAASSIDSIEVGYHFDTFYWLEEVTEPHELSQVGCIHSIQKYFFLWHFYKNLGNVRYALNHIKYIFSWYWLREVTALEDFKVDLGNGNIKVYPFLRQRGIIGAGEPTNYLNVGQTINGIVYFEGFEGMGDVQPKITREYVKVKIRVKDTFGRYHSKLINLPMNDLERAREWNEAFGMTMELNQTSEEGA